MHDLTIASQNIAKIQQEHRPIHQFTDLVILFIFEKLFLVLAELELCKTVDLHAGLDRHIPKTLCLCDITSVSALACQHVVIISEFGISFAHTSVTGHPG